MANIFDALDYAASICWNENYGYRYGGYCRSYADGCDCGGLVFHSLNHVGFNIPNTSPGVRNMRSYLLNAGFTEIAYNRLTFIPQDGDIFCCFHPNNPDDPEDNAHGHTFYYAENIRAYTDPNANSDNIGIVRQAKVEASQTHGHTAPGDHRKNGTGAYYEVWVHAYNNLVDHSTYADSEVKVYRIGGTRLNKYLLFQWSDRKKHPLPINPNFLF